MNLDIETIQSIVCNHYGITPKTLFKASRKREIIEVRHIFHYLAKKYTRQTYKKIGGYSNRNYATVMHSVNHINDMKFTDKNFELVVEEIEIYVNELSDILKNHKVNSRKNPNEMASEILSNQITSVI